MNQHQPNHRFKSIGYSEIKSEEGNENKFGVLVSVEGNESQLNSQVLQYETNLKSLFGVNYNPKVDSTKILPDSKALLTVSVIDSNTNIKLPARHLVLYLNQPNVKMQLSQVFVNKFIQLVPLHPPSKEEIDEYLKIVPQGIDELLWNQAKLNNPDPKKFIPVPLIGFQALNERFKLQEQETQQQRQRLRLIVGDIENLERAVAVMRTKVDERKRKNVILGNRVLSVMVWQVIRRQRIYPVQAHEDQLRAKLEGLQAELNDSSKLKSKLNDLMGKLKEMQNQTMVTSFTVDDSLIKEVKAYLSQEQEAIKHLLSLAKTLNKNSSK